MNKHVLWSAVLTLLVLGGGASGRDDITYLPPPYVEEPPLAPPPSLYFSVDFAYVQPRLRGTGGGDDAAFAFSPALDWTVSPRFEIGFTDRGAWNPYVGYRGIYSDVGEATYEPFTDTIFLFSRSTELHAIDLGLRSSPFCLLSVVKAEWDVSARLTVTDFRDVYDVDFAGIGFFTAKARQQFVGAGPRGGIRLELPLRDTGFSIGAQADGGVQWGGYRTSVRVVSFDDEGEFDEGDRQAKGGLLWHVGGQLALKYVWPGPDPRLVFSAGYLYEAWLSKEFGLFDGHDNGRFDYHGPFVRFEWRF